MNFYLQSEQPTSSYPRLESGDYELVVRQHPKEALITQAGKEKNRKPIDPPPIVQLKVPEAKDPIRQFLQSPYLFMMCHLEPDDSSISEQEAKEALTGSISSSLHRLKDVDNQDGGFFVFGDISVKTPGTHRLRFTLMELQKDEGRVSVSKEQSIQCSTKLVLKTSHLAYSQAKGSQVQLEPGIVCLSKGLTARKHWRGLEESTYLSRAFSDQGVRLRLRKENRTMTQKRNFTSYQDPQPGPSSTAGEQQAGSAYGASPVSSQYGFGEGTQKRQRSDDFGQPGAGMFASGERVMPGYASRDFNSSMSSTTVPYPLQTGHPRQSPQTGFGFQQPSGPSSSMSSYYGQGQAQSSTRDLETSTRQAQVTTPGGSYSFQTGGMATDPNEYFARRTTESYQSMQQAPPGMAGGVAGTPTEGFPGASQSMYTPTGPSGGNTASMYHSSSLTSPMGGPTTGGSSASVHTPASARGAVLNPSAQSFTLASQNLHQSLPSQQLASHGYSTLPDPQQYSYGQAQFAVPPQQQNFQQAPAASLPNLNQPLTLPHQQRPPDPDDPYGQRQQQQQQQQQTQQQQGWPPQYGP